MPPDYALMNQLLFEGKHEPVKQMTEAALAEGRPAMEVLEEGLIAGMRVVGEDFKYNRVFVPEVLLAARAMKAGMAVLKPLLTERRDEARKASAVIVMGTVKGDLHDIGKNLVGMMAEGAGFTIVDLGTDTSAEKFIAAAKEHKARIVGHERAAHHDHGLHAHGGAEVQGGRARRRAAVRGRGAGELRLREADRRRTATPPTRRARSSCSSG